jgi:hypothetical protein
VKKTVARGAMVAFLTATAVLPLAGAAQAAPAHTATTKAVARLDDGSRGCRRGDDDEGGYGREDGWDGGGRGRGGRCNCIVRIDRDRDRDEFDRGRFGFGGGLL